MFRILRLLLIALLACSSTTYSQEKPPLEMRLGPDALPLATVYDCVNVITGEFFLSDTTSFPVKIVTRSGPATQFLDPVKFPSVVL